MHIIEGLNRTLNDRQLEIWEGRSGLLPEKEEAYRRRWRGEKKQTTTRTTDAGNTQVKCPHLGQPTGEEVGCRSCSKSMVSVYRCDLHNLTTLVKGAKSDGIACCKYCDDNPSNIAIKEKRLLKSLPVIERLRSDADAFLANLLPYPESRYEGRGITIAAGGNYWPSAYVTIRMLRHVGCELPIQVWYLGADDERDERYEGLLTPYGVEFVDIDTHPARIARRIVKGFGCKLFAAVNSTFAEVLSLDPDCYPCSDPTVLFDLPEYKKLGGIYWPDGEHTNAWTHWDFWGVTKRGPCGLETGLYVLNKRTAWEPMMLAEFYDDHQDWCYGGAGGHGGGDYGDKGPHRVAWAKMNRDYVVFSPIPGYQKDLGFIQTGPDGKTPMFIHRCHSKFTVSGPLKFVTTPQHGENLRTSLPGEDAAFGFLEELKASL